MKIGGEYSSDKVTPKDFEQLAEEAGLANPIVKNRVPELAETVIANFDKAGIEHPVAQAVAAVIRKRCETVRNEFKNMTFDILQMHRTEQRPLGAENVASHPARCSIVLMVFPSAS